MWFQLQNIPRKKRKHNIKKFKNNFAEKIQKIQMQKTENNINTEQK